MIASYLQTGRGALSFAVRTQGDPGALAGAVRETVRELDSGLAVYQLRPMHEIVAASIAMSRFSMFLLLVFATAALLLAGVGVYGVTSQTVAQRTPEIGVRIALGATPRDIMGSVFGRGLLLTGAGVAGGVVGAWLLARVMGTLLYEVSPTSVPSYVLAGATVVAASTIASWVPARRAMRVDPIVALRSE